MPRILRCSEPGPQHRARGGHGGAGGHRPCLPDALGLFGLPLPSTEPYGGSGTTMGTLEGSRTRPRVAPLQPCPPQPSAALGLALASGGGQEPGQHQGPHPQDLPLHSGDTRDGTAWPPVLCFREGRRQLSTALGQLQQG